MRSRSAGSLQSGGIRATSSTTSCSRWWPRCGRPATRVAAQYPARYLFEFLDRHRMLTMSNAPVWRTINGGSRQYVQRAVKHISAVHTSTAVRSVTRHADGVEIRDNADRVFHADRVVIATHPDQALAMLTDPTPAEREVLGALPYSTTRAVLHTDRRLFPPHQGPDRVGTIGF